MMGPPVKTQFTRLRAPPQGCPQIEASPWLQGAPEPHARGMQQMQKVSKIAGGFLAHVWMEGRQIMGFGRTEEAALTDLDRNVGLIDRVRSRPSSQRGLPKTQG